MITSLQNLRIISLCTLFIQGLSMAHNYPGFLCVIEGIDGSGKTKLVKYLGDYFSEQNHAHIITKEPGSTALSKNILEMILLEIVTMTPQAEFLLFAADRAKHFLYLIIHNLEKGILI